MIEELNAKNEEADNTISPATSEHPDTVEKKSTDIADENSDDQVTSTEENSVESDVIEVAVDEQEEAATAVDNLPKQEAATAADVGPEEETATEADPQPEEETATAVDQNLKEETATVAEEQPKEEAEVVTDKLDEEVAKAAADKPATDSPEEVAPATDNLVSKEPVKDEASEEEAATAVDNLPKKETATKADSDASPSQEVSKDSKEPSSQEDLVEKEEETHEEPVEEVVDYSALSKEELVEIVKAIAKDDNVVKADKVLLEVKPHIDKFRKAEREEAKARFIAEGGEEDDFEFRHDELSTRFDANYRLIKDRKSKYFQEKEKQKDVNLKKKQDLLEQIREFVDSDETNISFEKFKAYQTEWKNIGMVPNTYNRTLWANYNALMDRFYDHRSIYFELKELDRRKNLESKIELCVKAEALNDVEHLNEAIKALNELHDEFKHLGPVPKEEQEPLWQRFKAASDVVYAKRKDYVEHLKVSQEENLVKKLELVTQIQVFTEFTSDRIKEWNDKTKEVLALQKLWEAVGGMPRERAKEINKQFWAAFKTFFHNKGDFFKALDAKREGNLAEKMVLIEKAKELKDSTDWMKTTNELIKLQKAWKESGPVPEKVRNSTYQQFKEACDFFFEQKRSQNKAAESAYVENLALKKTICEKIEGLASDGSADIEALRVLQDEFNGVGFVPKRDIGTIKSLYAESVDKFINAIPDIDNEERQRIRLENQLNKLANDPNAGEKIFRKEQTIRKQISKVENDITLWKNNMEFFASSKNADKVRDEFNAKIDVATKEMTSLKQQLRVLRSIE